MDVELLIMKVKENRAIYDASDKNHSKRNFIASVWRKIGDDLCITEDQLKRKWHQLRSNYMRVKRSEKKQPGSGATTKTRWSFYDLMSFLDEFHESRDMSGNVQQESPQQPLPLCDESGTDENVSITERGSAEKRKEPEITTAASCVKKEFKRRKESAAAGDIVSQNLSELRKVNSSRPDGNDPDRLFLLSLLPSIKQLSPADSIDFKLYTLQFLKSKLNPNSSCDRASNQNHCGR